MFQVDQTYTINTQYYTNTQTRSLHNPNSLPYDAATPLRAVHLHRIAHAQANATVSEQRGVRLGVNAKIEVEVRAVLVRPLETGLRAQRVALRWA
jgi:hypothetical protein